MPFTSSIYSEKIDNNVFFFSRSDLDTPEEVIAAEDSNEPLTEATQEPDETIVEDDNDPQQQEPDEVQDEPERDQDDRHAADEVDHRRPQFQQFPPASQFRSPLFSTPPPNFNNARMPQPPVNRFWNNNNNNNNAQTGNNTFSPRQWNSPPNFRGSGININMQRQPLRGPIPSQMLAHNFNVSANAGNFNSSQPKIGSVDNNNGNFNLPSNMGGNFNALQNQFNAQQAIQVGGNLASAQQFNNLNRFNSPQQKALIMLRNQLVNRFNSPQPQPLMSIVTQNELEDEGNDRPPTIEEIEDNASQSDEQQQNDEDNTDASAMTTTVDELLDFPKGDVDMRVLPPSIVSGNDDDQKSDTGSTSVSVVAGVAGGGSGIVGDQSNDSATNSSGRPNSASDSVGGGDQAMSIPKLPRKPNPFSKAPPLVMDTNEQPTNFQQPPRALLDIPAAPFAQQPPFNNNNMGGYSMGYIGSPRMPGLMGNGGGGPGNNQMGGQQQQFFSPQQQSMPFSPIQMRGRGGVGGNGSPYFRQNRGGPIGGPGRPQMGMNRGGGSGGHDGGFRGGRGGGRGNFRGKW